MALKDLLLPEFDHEMAVTRRVLERVPLGDRDWKPHPRSMSVGGLAAHLVDIPSWAPAILERDGYDMGHEPPEPAPRARFASNAELLSEFDRHVQAARTLIDGASDAQLQQTWTLRRDGQVVLALPRLAALRSFLLSHTIHHRGQMSVYLRLKDVSVPSIYGPSADEQ